MASWIAANQRSKPRAFDRTEKDMGSVVSPKQALNLMQNCDLPPPANLLSGPDDMFLSSMTKLYSKRGGQEAKEDEQLRTYRDCSENEKLELLKALRLSQTRAREAERKLAVLSQEKDLISNLLIEESLQLFAHRQWISLMEFQVFKLQRQQGEENDNGVSNCGEKSSKEEDHDEGASSKKWCAAIAFCLAIAGMGFAFGCGFLF